MLRSLGKRGRPRGAVRGRRESQVTAAGSCGSDESTKHLDGCLRTAAAHELRCRRRRVRPLHGPVLDRARSTDGRPRRGSQRAAGARCRLWSGRAHDRIGVARSGRRASRRSILPSRSSWPLESAKPGCRRCSRRRPSDCRSRMRTFDVALAQLVVHFMADPVAGLTGDGPRDPTRWRRRRVRLGPCRRRGPLSIFWRAARELDPDVHDESRLAGAREGHLAELFEAVGLREIQQTTLSVALEHPSFEEWWEPYTRGVGPAGAYVAGLDPTRRAQLRANLSRAAAKRPVRGHGTGVGSPRSCVGRSEASLDSARAR